MPDSEWLICIPGLFLLLLTAPLKFCDPDFVTKAVRTAVNLIVMVVQGLIAEVRAYLDSALVARLVRESDETAAQS